MTALPTTYVQVTPSILNRWAVEIGLTREREASWTIQRAAAWPLLLLAFMLLGSASSAHLGEWRARSPGLSSGWVPGAMARRSPAGTAMRQKTHASAERRTGPTLHAGLAPPQGDGPALTIPAAVLRLTSGGLPAYVSSPFSVAIPRPWPLGSARPRAPPVHSFSAA